MFARTAAVIVSLCCLASGQAPPPEVRLTGAWSVSITVPAKGSSGTERPMRVELNVPPLAIDTVTNERHAKLPDFDFTTKAGWRKGARLSGVVAEECTVQGALDPASLVVRSGTESDATTFVKGRDYEADLDAGTVGRLPSGGIGAEQPVFLSYRYGKQRIDSIVQTAGGKVELRTGTPHAVTPEQPSLGSGDVRLANLLISGRDASLREENLFPILEAFYPQPLRGGKTVAEERLPKTVARLQSGEPLKILAWGDSVSTYKRYQTMFVEQLRQQFPKARIELVTEAWGGRNTGSYLKEPPGSEHNYQEKVLAQKPDLIISEFVNDASLNEQQVQERYGQLLADFRNIGAEWIILTPHYVRPDWMGLARQRDIDDDPRPYVKGVRRFAEERKVAVADASSRYGRLWRQGIPYLTLMENNINHPNLFGHRIFAESLMALFR